jgi:hypothetical protein
MIGIMLLKKVIGIAVTVAIIGFGYHYLKDRGVKVPTPPVNPASQLQSAQSAAQQYGQ